MNIIEPISIDHTTVISNVADLEMLSNMFNGLSRIATSNGGKISVQFEPGKRYNSLSLLNVDADYVAVTMTHPDDGFVYGKYLDLVNYSGINSYYDWCFREPLKYKNFALFDLPIYDNSTLLIVAKKSTGDVVIGECIVGQHTNVGELLYEIPYNTTGNTKKSRDSETNIVSLVPGENAINPTFLLKIEDYRFYHLRDLLNSFHNTNLVFAEDENSEGIVYGFITGHSGIRKGFNKSTYSISIEELTGW